MLDGRYGYLAPTEEWLALKSGEQVEIQVKNWLFAGTQLVGRQGFHLTEVDPALGTERLLGSPNILPPVLAPIKPHREVKRLSPSCSTKVQDAANNFRRYADVEYADPSLTVIPAVKTLKATGEVFKFDGFHIEAPPELAGEKLHLQSFLPQAGGGGRRGIVLLDMDPSLPDNTYLMAVTAGGIGIEGSNKTQVFYAIQTLRQLLRLGSPCEMPRVKIADSPDFAHRALYLDIARHFHGLPQLKKVVSAMAAYKLNRLQLGISNDEGWRLEILGLPELTEVGSRRAFQNSSQSSGQPKCLYPAWGDNHELTEGFLQRQEFIELLTHARLHHVEVVVELNLPGHANAIIKSFADSDKYQLTDPADKSEHLSAQGYTSNVVNVCLPDTYRFAKDVLQAIKYCYDEANVPFNLIHLGGDEVPDGAWLGSPVCQQSDLWQPQWDMNKRKDRQAATAALTRHYLKRITDIAESISPGLQTGFWHEMGPYAADNNDRHKNTNKNAYYNCWGAETDKTQAAKQLLAAKQRLVISNASYLYFDMP
ncbi:MAG: family 20 glycosylhydrolase, partial [Pseudomonadales bacterium]